MHSEALVSPLKPDPAPSVPLGVNVRTAAGARSVRVRSRRSRSPGLSSAESQKLKLWQRLTPPSFPSLPLISPLSLSGFWRPLLELERRGRPAPSSSRRRTSCRLIMDLWTEGVAGIVAQLVLLLCSSCGTTGQGERRPGEEAWTGGGHLSVDRAVSV